MPGVKKLIRPLLTRALRRQGFALLNLRGTFGIDFYADVHKLAKSWNYPIHDFFDVGANHGDTALTALEEFPQAQVVSFEPHPQTFKRLQERMAGQSRHRCVNLAFGPVSGRTEMFEYESSKENSLVPNARPAFRFQPEKQKVPVQVSTLDAYCSENQVEQVDVLKIDTEGFDLCVLEGARGLLSSAAVKFIYFEFNDLRPREGVHGGALLPFDELLWPYGYRFVATYTDYIVVDSEVFNLANALFALPPKV